MKSKGFTLIELLAVIVILAIIALIATPIILNIIEDAKEESAERSAENYIEAVELAVAKANLNGEFNPNSCNIQANGYIKCGDYEPIKVEVDGEVPEELTGSKITFNEGKVTGGNFKISGTNFVIEDGKLVISSNNGGETSNQENKPQFYYFGNGSDWDSFVTTFAPVESERLTDAPEGENIYLGYDVTDDIVTAAYVCFKNNETEYCLKGEHQAEKKAESYATNKGLLIEIFGEEACFGVGESIYNCGNDSLGVEVQLEGIITVGDGNVSCYFLDSGRFECSW